MEPVLPTVDELPLFEYTDLTRPSSIGPFCSIRLFRIKPGLSGDLIRLSLFESDLSYYDFTTREEDPELPMHDVFEPHGRYVPSQNEYIAVSYAWGDESETMTISVNDAFFEVTQNLYQFLEQMRCGLGTGPYWVDAICINQSDDKEKSQQVSLMSRIFIGTWLGIVWLGVESDDSHLAFALLELVDVRIYPKIKNESLASFCDYLLGYSPRAWQATWKLLTRSWFRRVWTVQEFVLPSQLDIVCGPRTVSWRVLVKFAYVFRFLDEPSRRKLGIVDELVDALRGFETTCWHKAHWVPPDRYRQTLNNDVHEYRDKRKVGINDLLNSVQTHRHRETTDDRDKIFGLIGLNADEEYPVDYRLPTGAVYHRFAIYYLGRVEPWRVLVHAGYPRSMPHLPSWVPDWSTPQPATNTNLRPDLYVGAGGILHGCRSWGCFRLAHDKITLVGRGLILGAIIYSQPATSTDFSAMSGDDQQSWLRNNETLCDHILAYEDLQTMSDDLDEFALTKLLRVRSFGLEYDLDGQERRMSAPQSIRRTPSAPDYTKGRSFFVAEGGFLGLGPREIEAGDVAIIFVGLPFPFIVRRKDKYGAVVGPCYIDGVMDGEMRTGTRKRKIRDFQIR